VRRPRVLTLFAGAVIAASTSIAIATPAQAAPAAALDEVDQYIVQFKPGADRSSALATLGQRFGVQLTTERELSIGAHVIKANKRTAGLLKALQALGVVEYAEPDTMMQALSTPNDPLYNQQWDLFETIGGINVPTAWDLSTGSGVIVAVIDTGKTSHPDLNAQWVGGYDFISSASVARDGGGRDSDPTDPGDWYNAGECGSSTGSSSSWHGTHVAGTIAGVGNNSTGIAGIAYNAKILPVRVLGKCGGSTSDIIDAITWASGGSVAGVPANTNVAKVINLSLGGSGSCSTAMRNAINAAVNRGTTVVVAAGNSNANASGFSPANCPNVITVAATNRAGSRAFYSNYGATVEISAPGGEVRLASDPAGSRTTPQNGILSTLNNGTTTIGTPNYWTYMGTSMAAPHVAGVVALMKSKNPSLTPAQILSKLQSTARALPGTCSGGCGAGIVNAAAAVAAA
jgi:serine protease